MLKKNIFIEVNRFRCDIFQGDKDFPEAAVKAMHEKRPLPTHENRPTHSPQKIIQQPRK